MSEPKHCLNCLKDLEQDAKYCAGCGQKVQPLKTTLRNLVVDFWAATVSIDGKFLRSFRMLFTRPGRLTAEYIAGKRAAYLSPATVFLLAAGAFFIGLNWVQGKREEAFAVQAGENLRVIQIIPGFNITLNGTDLENVFEATDEEIREYLNAKRKAVAEQQGDGSVTELTPFQEFMATKAIRLVRDGGVLALRHRITETCSRSTALLAPMMAVLVRLLHFRRKMYMVDGIVYCLHLHAFLFAVFLMSVVLPDENLRVGSVLLLLPVTLWYTASSLKTAFGNSLLVAWGKAFALLLLHSISVCALTLGLVIALLALS